MRLKNGVSKRFLWQLFLQKKEKEKAIASTARK
jgi:hypothetical protein